MTLLPVSITAVAPQAASIVVISELDFPERILPDIVCNKAYPTQVSKEILQKLLEPIKLKKTQHTLIESVERILALFHYHA